MKKKRVLGRGLDVLLAGSRPHKTGTADGTLQEMPVDIIRPGKYQPRTGMDPQKLQELADSIASQGLVQPIVVRSVGENQYEIIAGERRWRAAQLASLDRIPAIVRDVPDNIAIALALVENIQRENLNPLEEANALHRLLHEFQLTHEQAASAVGRSRAAVSNLLRLRDLNDDVKSMVDNGQLSMGHARALLALKGGQQSKVARVVAARGLSVRQTENLVRSGLSEPTASAEKAEPDPNILALEGKVGERLGASVKIVHGAKGGKLVISYHSLDELDGIVAHIK